MASPSLAGEAFAPYRLREGARAEEALAEVRVALARREVQLASLLDIVRQMEAEVQRVRVPSGLVGANEARALSRCAAGRRPRLGARLRRRVRARQTRRSCS